MTAEIHKLNVKSGWEQVGHCDVDSGLIWIGDPCYVLPLAGKKHSKTGLDYTEMCDTLDRQHGPTIFKHDAGHEGMGICTSNHWGDGSYPVSVKRNKDGAVTAMKIEFE